jgi:hypothetical protein
MGLISLVLAALGFVAGWGLLERRQWARSLAIVVAIIAILNPILGTVLGIYTLWVLLPLDAEWHQGLAQCSPAGFYWAPWGIVFVGRIC